MAQYFQIKNSDRAKEVNQLFPASDEDQSQTIQYVISQREHQNQFSNQQVVVDQFMVVDGQTQQVVLDPSQISYHSSYIIQDQIDFPLDFPENQKVFYMTSPSQSSTQIAVVEPPQIQPTPNIEPIILNPFIQSNQLTKSIQTSQQHMQSNQVISQQQQIEQTRHVTNQQDISNYLQQQRQMFENNLTEEDVKKEEVVTLANGTMVPISEYKKMLLQQQQMTQKRQIQKNIQERLNYNTTGLVGGIQEQEKKGRHQISARRKTPSNANDDSTSQYQSSINPQQQRYRQNSYIIRPPNKNNQPLVRRPLPQFLHTLQIRHIIENTPISEEYSDSIRMLILLQNGEQRLITFTLPKEPCNIQEILEQVNVPFTQETPIEVTEVNANGINYVVTVGHINELYGNTQVHLDDSASSTSTIASSRDKNSDKSSVSEIISSDSLEMVTTNLTGDMDSTKSSTPEPPKLIPGKLAICSHCGYLSEDFNKCTRCKRKLPETVKVMDSIEGKNQLQQQLNERKIENTNEKKFLNKPHSLGALNTPKLNLLNKKKLINVPNRLKLNECETVVVSSDDENDDSNKKLPLEKNVNNQLLQNLCNSITISPISKEPSVADVQKQIQLPFIKKFYKPDEILSTSIHCRTIRIGSYRYLPTDEVQIDSLALHLKVPVPNQDITKYIKIETSEIMKVLVSFQKPLFVIFYYVYPNVGERLRKELGINDNSDYYFDPLSATDESHRRITLLPENISDENNLTLYKIYSSNNIFDELTYKEANDILIKTCPKEGPKTYVGVMPEVKQLLMYPPEGRGRIAINTEDYLCLGQEQFLNDVIIDFYLTFLFNNLPKNQQSKVHIFSTFFYKRLTTKPIKASRKSQPTELDPNLTPAQKRHARVKTWTKNVNLFEKDFIIIPINEHSHWFLAVICFPNMEGTETMEGQPIKIEPKIKIKKKCTTRVKTKDEIADESILCEDPELSDKDEAEGDDSELESDDSSEEGPPTVEFNNRPPIKQPCILIFDSLTGASRHRVVATLRDYLTCEYKVKMNQEKFFTKDVIKGACPKVPQQTNFTDCGLYLLHYAEQFFKNPIKDFYIPIKHLKDWFEEIEVTRKREEISQLIKELMTEYGNDLSLLPDIAFPSLKDNEDDTEDKFFDEEEDETDNYCPDISPCPTNVEHIEDEMKASKSNSTVPFTIKTRGHNILLPTINDLPKQSNRETLSYLKAKRIVRHKNVNSSDPLSNESSDTKKAKISE